MALKTHEESLSAGAPGLKPWQGAMCPWQGLL